MTLETPTTLAEHQADICASTLWQPHPRTSRCDYANALVDPAEIQRVATSDFGEAGFHAGANPFLGQKGRKAVANTSSLRTRAGRLGLLLNPSATQSDYDALSRCNDNVTRFAVAGLVAKRLSEDAILELAFDEEMAYALASITGLPKRVYGLVMGVRNALPVLVQNPNCPQSLLQSVLAGDNVGVSYLMPKAVKNPSLSIESLLRLPATDALTAEQYEEAVFARKKEAEAWLSKEYGNDIDLEVTPLEWVRELLSS